MKKEQLNTLSFPTKKVAKENETQIKDYFGNRLVESNIRVGVDERGKKGFQIHYTISN
jgi:hypothetical protein